MGFFLDRPRTSDQKPGLSSLQRCLSRLRFISVAFQVCFSGLRSRLLFRVASQGCFPGLLSRIAFQDCFSGLLFRVAFQCCFQGCFQGCFQNRSNIVLAISCRTKFGLMCTGSSSTLSQPIRPVANNCVQDLDLDKMADSQVELVGDEEMRFERSMKRIRALRGAIEARGLAYQRALAFSRQDTLLDPPTDSDGDSCDAWCPDGDQVQRGCVQQCVFDVGFGARSVMIHK